MPLTSKGSEILENMEKEYGDKQKAEQILYASQNAGKISGIDSVQKIVAKDEAHEIIPASISLPELQKKNEEYWSQSYDLMNKDIEVE